ncbi:sulfurtransferase TusA family protein [Haloarcula amylovorans]|uniref:sulfurtransferase TusA family protein n=1 Tax=Haloarcula amylovorans TaxID=2562280 RepID=UPI001075EBC5|nr:sulfurtransferase TusA family protein [Halomicroarcula amylolytica]
MTDTDIQPDETVDARGAACPGPMMDLVGAIRSADEGTVVRLLSDNDQSLTDVPEWVESTGNELLAVEEFDDHVAFDVEKA